MVSLFGTAIDAKAAAFVFLLLYMVFERIMRFREHQATLKQRAAEADARVDADKDRAAADRQLAASLAALTVTVERRA